MWTLLAIYLTVLLILVMTLSSDEDGSMDLFDWGMVIFWFITLPFYFLGLALGWDKETDDDL